MAYLHKAYLHMKTYILLFPTNIHMKKYIRFTCSNVHIRFTAVQNYIAPHSLFVSPARRWNGIGGFA